MKKIKVITTCFDCQDYFGWNKETSEDRCRLSQKDIENAEKIPSWCQLENYGGVAGLAMGKDKLSELYYGDYYCPNDTTNVALKCWTPMMPKQSSVTAERTKAWNKN